MFGLIQVYHINVLGAFSEMSGEWGRVGSSRQALYWLRGGVGDMLPLASLGLNCFTHAAVNDLGIGL